MIVNRSTYLQGLLVMSEDDVIRKLPQAHPYRERLEEFVIRHKCSLKELVLGYVFSHPGITSTILGVDSPEQFEENLSIFMRKNIGNDVIDKVRKTFKDVPEDILNPGLWKKS
jgi:aryl-alcohol dehydrogenase-like predicted oxidoreductase